MVAQEIFKYEKLDPGPYKVNICHKDDRDSFLNTMVVGQDLVKNGFLDIAQNGVQRVSKKVVSVTFNNYKSANKIVDHEKLREKYKIYILKNFIYSDGFVKIDPDSVDWDGQFGVIEQIKKENSNIKEVRRIKYKSRNERGEEVEKYSYKTAITFRLRKIPEVIHIFRCVKKVFPFINKTRFCDNCGFYGHLKEKCNRKKDEYCRNCFTKGHATCEKTFCKHCKKSDHSARDETCPEIKRQEKINRIMAINNIGFNEAKKYIRQDTNYYTQLEDFQQFPQLPNPQRNNLKNTFSRNESPKASVSPFPDGRGSNKRRRNEQKQNSYQRNPYNEKPIDPLSTPSLPMNFSEAVKSKEEDKEMVNFFQENIQNLWPMLLPLLKKWYKEKTQSDMDFQSAEESPEKNPPRKLIKNQNLVAPATLNIPQK